MVLNSVREFVMPHGAVVVYNMVRCDSGRGASTSREGMRDLVVGESNKQGSSLEAACQQNGSKAEEVGLQKTRRSCSAILQ